MPSVGIITAKAAEITVGTGGTYAGLNSATGAFTNAQSGDTVKLVSDITATGGAGFAGKSLTLDLNGFTYTRNVASASEFAINVASGATLTIKDSSAAGTGKFLTTGSNGCTINISGGTLNVESGTFLAEGIGIRTIVGQVGSNSNANIKGGTLTSDSGGTSSCVSNFGAGTINISGGTLTGVIGNGATGTINITGGAITSSFGTVGNNAEGIVNISGGTITSTQNDPAVSNGSSGNINITGGTIENTGTGVAIRNHLNSSGKITIGQDSDKTTFITSKVAGSQGTVYIDSPASAATKLLLEITGGTIQNTATTGNQYSVYFTKVTLPNLPIVYLNSGGTVGKVYPAPVTYTVTYNGNGNTGGTVPTDSSSPYISGSSVTILGNTDNLERTGYTFSGWNTSSNGAGTNYAAGDTLTVYANTTLYAKWTQPQTTPTATIDYAAEQLTGLVANASYKINGTTFTADSSGKININSAWLGTTIDIVRAGNNSSTTDSTAQPIAIASRPSAPEASVVTIAAGNSGSSTKITLANTYEYYIGSSEPTSTTTWITGSATTADVAVISGQHVYVRLKATDIAPASIYVDAGEVVIGKDAAAYTITYNGNGSLDTMLEQAFRSGMAENLAQNTFARSGYSFVGWNTQANGKGTSYKGNQNVILTSSLTLYAQWSYNPQID